MHQAFPIAGLLVSLLDHFTVLYSYMIQRKNTDCGRRTVASSTVLYTSFASLAVFSYPILRSSLSLDPLISRVATDRLLAFLIAALCLRLCHCRVACLLSCFHCYCPILCFLIAG
ncbi:uncharacterized protein F5147DRAFT_674621 [Suillus discolor]|uniref:Uncharacterized protein n=1 Tax=Suillus discolor TaxID=1912936 RepID=A0A9P7FG83_9AGAM|nr:uncharacterized protein F5147DRAFT_674621 [Suillus discolor]KAG2115786.1 hypothetical protein F5147DRAFT_674621 [Suillus discolor]